MTKADYPRWPVRVVINLSAYRQNLVNMRRFAPRAQQMAIVKANAYGHGMERMALAALEAGVQWLGVAKSAEAYQLRQYLDSQGVARNHFSSTPTSAMMRSQLYQDAHHDLPTSRRPRILSWIYTPQTNLKSLIKSEIDLSVSTLDQLDQVSHAADAIGLRARIHLKIDTGLSRAGATSDEFPVLCKLARARERSGLVEVSAVWSHLSCSDEGTEAAEDFTKAQLAAFATALEVAAEAGLQPRLRHIAASGGIIWYPESHYDMVRVGIAGYGLSPNPEMASAPDLGLRPVMRLETDVMQVKRVPAGTRASYGGEWEAPSERWLALLPIGYADGIHRAAKNRGQVWINGRIASVVGRIPMDQIIVDLGPARDDQGVALAPPAAAGDRAVIFGDPNDEICRDFEASHPLPSADDWALNTDTINYEVLTAVSKTAPRYYIEDSR